MWLWTQRCRLTGETLEVYLTDDEKRAIEKQPVFRGWERGDLIPVEECGWRCPACDAREGRAS